MDDVPLAQLLDEYDAECARSNEIVAGVSLDDVERVSFRESGGRRRRATSCVT